MANLDRIISAKTANDENWKLQRQAERDNTVGMRDAGILDVTSNPAMYGQYLDLQGSNPSYSAGNIILAMYQLKAPTMIGTQEKWRNLGRYVMEAEKSKGAKIFVRPSGPNARGYNLGDAYDVSQTQGRPVGSVKLEENTRAMDNALATLLNYSPVPVVSGNGMEVPAYYDEQGLELVINPNHDDKTAFAAIATGIALARMHNKGQNTYFDRSESLLDADSVSYLLCRRFGIDRPLPDASNIAALNDGFSVEERTNALNKVQDMAKQIGSAIDRQINRPHRTQSRTTQPTR